MTPRPAEDIDPIEELARIINEAQERDAKDERPFDELGSERPMPQQRPRRGAPILKPDGSNRRRVGGSGPRSGTASGRECVKTPSPRRVPLSACGTRCGTKDASIF